jgi:hypothetical protein
MRFSMLAIAAVGSLVLANAAQALPDSGKHGFPEAPPTVLRDAKNSGGGGGGNGQQPNPYLRLLCPQGCPLKGDPFHRPSDPCVAAWMTPGQPGHQSSNGNRHADRREAYLAGNVALQSLLTTDAACTSAASTTAAAAQKQDLLSAESALSAAANKPGDR